jgi:hypothetical protein
VLVVYVRDGHLQHIDLLLHQSFEVGFVSAESNAYKLLVLAAFFERHHHAEIFPTYITSYLRWLFSASL